MTATRSAPLLEVDAVTLQYKTRDSLVTATQQVSFDIYAGERLILLGPSGCGKLTLLKAVGGFLRPTGGVITLGGRRIERPGPDRVAVFQEFDQLLPWKTVRRKHRLRPDRQRSRQREEALELAREYGRRVNLERFLDAYPHALSGGMKQRVAIARSGDEARHHPDGRALRRPRRPDPPADAGGVARALARDQASPCSSSPIRSTRRSGLGHRMVLLSPHPGRCAISSVSIRRVCRRGAGGISAISTMRFTIPVQGCSRLCHLRKPLVVSHPVSLTPRGRTRLSLPERLFGIAAVRKRADSGGSGLPLGRLCPLCEHAPALSDLFRHRRSSVFERSPRANWPAACWSRSRC